jgi:hypothetical protein
MTPELCPDKHTTGAVTLLAVFCESELPQCDQRATGVYAEDNDAVL